jgi:hypothetical protein
MKRSRDEAALQKYDTLQYWLNTLVLLSQYKNMPRRNKQWVAAQNRIVNLSEISNFKFIPTLSISIFQIWESTVEPKHPPLKPQHVNNMSSTLGWCLMANKSYFTVHSNNSLFARPSSQQRFDCGWLSMSIV